jgi:hypothetical protein
MPKRDIAVSQAELDAAIAESAEREAEAQLAIIRALKPLKGEDRRRVLECVHHLLEADKLVAGVFDAVGREFRRAAGERAGKAEL